MCKINRSVCSHAQIHVLVVHVEGIGSLIKRHWSTFHSILLDHTPMFDRRWWKVTPHHMRDLWLSSARSNHDVQLSAPAGAIGLAAQYQELFGGSETLGRLGCKLQLALVVSGWSGSLVMLDPMERLMFDVHLPAPSMDWNPAKTAISTTGSFDGQQSNPLIRMPNQWWDQAVDWWQLRWVTMANTSWSLIIPSYTWFYTSG